MIVALSLVSAAHAQQTCIEPMSRIQFGATIGQISDALEASELIEARGQLNALAERLPCLDDVVDRELFAFFARYNAIVYFYGQDEEQAARWGQASRIAKEDLPWDEQLYPQGNLVRAMIDSVPLPALAVAGSGLSVPKRGGAFINGQFAPRPEAWPDLPVLVQIFDGNRERVDGFWQEGNKFPEHLISARAEDLPPPPWWQGEVSVLTNNREKIPRETSIAVVPIATSVGLGLISAVSYVFAAQTAATFRDDPHTSEELTALRTRANLLVLASGTTLASAVGVGVGGVLISGNGLTVRF